MTQFVKGFMNVNFPTLHLETYLEAVWIILLLDKKTILGDSHETSYCFQKALKNGNPGHFTLASQKDYLDWGSFMNWKCLETAIKQGDAKHRNKLITPVRGQRILAHFDE